MLDISWGISNICNYRCKHCFNVSGIKKLDELSFEDLKGVGRLLVKKGVKSIKFGTGEPGLEPKFWRIIEFMKKISDVKISLITNASSVTKETIDRVAKFVDRVKIIDRSLFFNNVGGSKEERPCLRTYILLNLLLISL